MLQRIGMSLVLLWRGARREGSCIRLVGRSLRIRLVGRVRVGRRRSHSEDEDCSNGRRTIGNASRRWKSRLCATRWTRTWYCALHSSVAMCGRSIERTYYATSKKYPTRCPDVLSSAWTTSQTRRESKNRHVARTTASTALCKPCNRKYSFAC
jgi:hypothetical protein